MVRWRSRNSSVFNDDSKTNCQWPPTANSAEKRTCLAFNHLISSAIRYKGTEACNGETTKRIKTKWNAVTYYTHWHSNERYKKHARCSLEEWTICISYLHYCTRCIMHKCKWRLIIERRGTDTELNDLISEQLNCFLLCNLISTMVSDGSIEIYEQLPLYLAR